MKKAGLSDAQLMEIGEAVDNGMGPGLAAGHFGYSKSTIYRGLRHFEKVTGKKLIGPSTLQKSQMRKAAKAKAKPGRANGAGTAIATVNDDWQRRAIEAEGRLHDLTGQLHHAIDEAHTLQKIVILLGRTL